MIGLAKHTRGSDSTSIYMSFGTQLYKQLQNTIVTYMKIHSYLEELKTGIVYLRRVSCSFPVLFLLIYKEDNVRVIQKKITCN